MSDTIKDMQRTQGKWHAMRAGECIAAARNWRDKAFQRGYVPENCLSLSREKVAQARKHNHLSVRYRRGDLTV